MVSGALGKISRLCPLSDGPSDDGFQLTLSVSKFTYLINAFCSLLFGAPSLGTLGSCPSRLPLEPPLLMSLNLQLYKNKQGFNYYELLILL